jgi:hypothetical protein
MGAAADGENRAGHGFDQRFDEEKLFGSGIETDQIRFLPLDLGLPGLQIQGFGKINHGDLGIAVLFQHRGKGKQPVLRAQGPEFLVKFRKNQHDFHKKHYSKNRRWFREKPNIYNERKELNQ